MKPHIAWKNGVPHVLASGNISLDKAAMTWAFARLNRRNVYEYDFSASAFRFPPHTIPAARWPWRAP